MKKSNGNSCCLFATMTSHTFPILWHRTPTISLSSTYKETTNKQTKKILFIFIFNFNDELKRHDIKPICLLCIFQCVVCRINMNLLLFLLCGNGLARKQLCGLCLQVLCFVYLSTTGEHRSHANIK